MELVVLHTLHEQNVDLDIYARTNIKWVVGFNRFNQLENDEATDTLATLL